MERNVMKRVISRYSKREITKEKYLQMKDELTPEDFAKSYEMNVDSYEPKYYEKVERSYEDLHLLMAYDRLVAQEKAEQHIKTIKDCAVFFTVLAIIGFVYGVIIVLAAFWS